MRWLAHHEFGADHRPFVFDAQNRPDGDPAQLDYWVQLWIHVYSALLDNLPSNAVLLNYERLCEEKNAVWNPLCERLHLECKSVHGLLRPPNKTKVTINNSELAKQAAELHAALLERAIQLLECGVSRRFGSSARRRFESPHAAAAPATPESKAGHSPALQDAGAWAGRATNFRQVLECGPACGTAFG